MNNDGCKIIVHCESREWGHQRYKPLEKCKIILSF